MKLPWQQPPWLVEGCSSVSVGWLADMLADGPSQLLGRGGMRPLSLSWESASQGSVLVILSVTAHQISQKPGMPDLGHRPQLV